jgi:peptidoglycan/xylan/chitin deacetylase (PgdA/CDA1 family)
MPRRLWAKVQGRLRKASVRFLFKRPLVLNADFPVISFTFDDFPRSALLEGGRILHRYNALGTYYVSLRLMGKQGLGETMFLLEDLKAVLEQGHELGCHTFGHCHSSKTNPEDFENSIIENRQALSKFLPEASLKTLSYPSSRPRPATKRRAARYFMCCRGGGQSQTFNAGTADLNTLSTFFLERSRDDPDAVKNLIDRNRRERGWLIFATHDISECPSPYGIKPDFFEQVVQWAVESGARILPVGLACEELMKAVTRPGIQAATE